MAKEKARRRMPETLKQAEVLNSRKAAQTSAQTKRQAQTNAKKEAKKTSKTSATGHDNGQHYKCQNGSYSKRPAQTSATPSQDNGEREQLETEEVTRDRPEIELTFWRGGKQAWWGMEREREEK